MSIYTRFGDKGKTSLYGGKTVSKGSLRIDAYGSIDELNSWLGVVLTEIKDVRIKKELFIIQSDLFEIGARLASNIESKKNAGYFEKRVKEFEKEMDRLTKKLPELMNFILPGGGKTGSFFHVARTVARRAERRTAELSEKEDINKEILIYMNRLSDLLFTFARYINYKENKKEIIWKSR
ncbi:MAG: cob(I)yrinic acid a,c-diamide adenosyltransferase [Patescibacteria group bacterium]|nr:cob(I)yrinic acid a,c-diamide adenosyltransferase [Patescibacteria group bacterium]